MRRNVIDEGSKQSVRIKDFCQECSLELARGNALEYITFSSLMVNRPGLLFTGFDDYFGAGRIQLIGNAEHYYLNSLGEEDRLKAMRRLLSKHVPCVIYARGIAPDSVMLDEAEKNNIPMFLAPDTTTSLSVKLNKYLTQLLAPTQYVHGTLLEISGIGVLITGNSGLGKSETALELIHRGHRLVSDDAVIIKRVNDELVGYPPEKIKYFMEVRGIGIIDVRRMYGVGAVVNSKDVDLVIELKKWGNPEDVDRLGDKRMKENILGVGVPKLVLPVMPGRNLAIVVETAARNYRLQNMGYDATAAMTKGIGINE